MEVKVLYMVALLAFAWPEISEGQVPDRSGERTGVLGLVGISLNEDQNGKILFFSPLIYRPTLMFLAFLFMGEAAWVKILP